MSLGEIGIGRRILSGCWRVLEDDGCWIEFAPPAAVERRGPHSRQPSSGCVVSFPV